MTTFGYIDPKIIQVDRENRQRREIVIDDLIPSVQLRGIIQPIIVRAEGNTYHLIAGERRLATALHLNLSQIPYRLWESLDPIEQQIIELEENLKRRDLTWKEEALAVKRIHTLYCQNSPDWTQLKTAMSLGFAGTNAQISIYLAVAEALENNDKNIHAAAGVRAAYNIIARRNERKLDDVMSEILDAPATVQPEAQRENQTERTAPYIPDLHKSSTYTQPKSEPAPEPNDSILAEDFNEWAKTYNGPRFNLIHCDFPYGVNMQSSDQGNSAQWGAYEDTPDVYWQLCKTLAENIDRLMSPSGHLMFWFSMDYYQATLDFFRQNAPSLVFNTFPLYWLKSDNRGILPDPKRGPRRIVETCFMASRGDRLIIKAVSNGYSAPTSKEIHQSEKPEPVLRHFMSMFVDENTKLLDPTCGSATSLRAAESLGAQTVLGLEINEQYRTAARSAMRRFRTLRRLESVA